MAEISKCLLLSIPSPQPTRVDSNIFCDMSSFASVLKDDDNMVVGFSFFIVTPTCVVEIQLIKSGNHIVELVIVLICENHPCT